MRDSAYIAFRYPETWVASELPFIVAGAALPLISAVILLIMLRKSNKKNAKLNQLLNELQQSQQELQSSEHSAKEFVANVSHEIHSSLFGIQSFANGLKQQDLTAEQRLHYAQMISEEVVQLSALSKQLLLLSRMENENQVIVKQQYLIKAQLRQALQLFEYQLTEKDIMSTLKANELSVISGDRVLMLQVWTNLLSNAIKYTPEGGSIIIEVSSNEQYCNVTVSDTGEGISEESIDYVFDRNYWKNRKADNAISSNGLGLSIVKRIVQLHGGMIQLISQAGEGTKVTVQLPQPTV